MHLKSLTYNHMTKIEKIILAAFLLMGLLSSLADAQTKKPKAKKDTTHFTSNMHPENIRQLAKSDTTESYTLHFKDIQTLYDLMQAGYNGVSTSDNFSKNQAKQYLQAYLHLDSLLKPQVLKWHPVKKEGTK